MISWSPHPHLPHEVGRVNGVTVARCSRSMADDGRPWKAWTTDRELEGRGDTPEDAKAWLETEYRLRVVRRMQLPEITPGMLASDILKAACETAGITVAQAKGDDRTPLVAFARWRVMAILRDRKWSLQRIADILGGRDHSTICHGLAQWERLQGHVTTPKKGKAKA